MKNHAYPSLVPMDKCHCGVYTSGGYCGKLSCLDALVHKGGEDYVVEQFGVTELVKQNNIMSTIRTGMSAVKGMLRS